MRPKCTRGQPADCRLPSGNRRGAYQAPGATRQVVSSGYPKHPPHKNPSATSRGDLFRTLRFLRTEIATRAYRCFGNPKTRRCKNNAPLPNGPRFRAVVAFSRVSDLLDPDIAGPYFPPSLVRILVRALAYLAQIRCVGHLAISLSARTGRYTPKDGPVRRVDFSILPTNRFIMRAAVWKAMDLLRVGIAARRSRLHIRQIRREKEVEDGVFSAECDCRLYFGD